jgi:pimeloyl-ACP methyl ester carboxylesterase
MQQLALRLASQGIPVLRFDYHGCGDSAGEAAAGCLERWTADISAAITELKRRTGPGRVGLVGMRLGGALASLAAAGRADIAGLALWEPVVNGRVYLDELRAWHQEMLWRFIVPPRPERASIRPSELVGFPMPERLWTELEGLDLMTMAPPPWPVLVVEHGAPGPGRRLAQSLQAQAAPATHAVVPTFRVWTEDVDKGLVPLPALQRIVTWLTEVMP